VNSLYRVYQAAGSQMPAYFIESTALNNVDDEASAGVQPSRGGLTELEPDHAIGKMAEYLAEAEQPEIVVIIHGFNNPRDAVLRRYAHAFKVASDDPPIRERKGLVCLGYRWPSEKIGQPLATLRSAAPAFLIGLFWSAALFFALTLAWPYLPISVSRSLSWWIRLAFYTLAGLLFFIPVVVSLLRLAVYFRDGYRAANYGVPDLVEVIRQLDREVTEKARRNGRAAEYKNRVKLSFIGHSMGGFVVTNVVRILSDVFSPPSAPRPPAASRADEYTVPFAQFVKQEGYGERPEGLEAGNADKDATPEIGDAFTLARLVLVSPDIPAETLLSNRANFLAPSLRRFREAHLFSNGGDEVLLQIAPIANYFSFPTRGSDHGLRLGNTEVLADCYGVTNLESLETKAGPLDEESFLEYLRVGRRTLKELYQQIEVGGQALKILPQIFTYFDCTYYIEDGKGVLGRAKPKPRVSKEDRLSQLDHFLSLLGYLADQKPDVHSGYFNENARLASQLIFRVACLGLAETLVAYHNAVSAENRSAPAPLKVFSNSCAERQIKVLLSPRSFQSLQKQQKASGIRLI
jgi:hypothetical protein